MLPGHGAPTLGATVPFGSEANAVGMPVAYKFPAEDGGEKASEAASLRSQGSTTHSVTSTVTSTAEIDEEQVTSPDVVDIRRLAKLKAEQEQKLLMLKARIDRLTSQERRVWKDVTWTQQMSLQAQEAQWRRQTQQAEQARLEREAQTREQALRERTREMRQRTAETKETPRIAIYEEKKVIGQKVREDSKRLMSALSEVRGQALHTKQMQVECQRQQRRQQRLRREMEQSRREQARQELNVMKYSELQEELQSVNSAIAAAEAEELSAVSRLQNSQSVRAEAIAELQASRAFSSSEAEQEPQEPREASPTPMTPRTQTLHSARGTRSSPRLGVGSPGSPQQASPGSPAVPVKPRQPHRLASSRSSTMLHAWTPTRTNLGQITEEEETSSVASPENSRVEMAVEEFRKQVASFQAQNQQYQAVGIQRLQPGYGAVRKL